MLVQVNKTSKKILLEKKISNKFDDNVI
jgi:hypothetical protein